MTPQQPPVRIPPQIYTAVLTEKKQLNARYFFLHLELQMPNRITFTAGQHVSLSVPGIDQRKSYSITSTPEMNHAVELLVDIQPQGPGSQYISQVNIGEEVSFLAPLGRYHITQQDDPICEKEKALTFIATGSGIAPFKSMIIDQLRRVGDTRKIRLIWGVRHEDDLVLLEKFEELQLGFPNFEFHPVISQAQPEWNLCRGHVDDCLNVHGFIPESGYYICGNKEMVQQIADLLIQKGISEDIIHWEKYN